MAQIPVNLRSSGTGPGAGSSFGDVRALDTLKRSATQDPKAAIKEAAKQCESKFMQQLLKSRRE